MAAAKASKAQKSGVAADASKSPKVKGKEKAQPSPGGRRQPSQLKQGWALVPLVLNANDNNDKSRKRSRSPQKSKGDAGPLSARKVARQSSSVAAPPKPSVAIEIPSDSDDDEIQEVKLRAVASTSKVTLEASKKSIASTVKAEAVETDQLDKTSGKSKPASTLPVLAQTFDLDEDEDDELERQAASASINVFADENDVLDEVDDWGDTERPWLRSRSGSRDGSTYDEEEMMDESNMFERSGDSDEDILELMEGEGESQHQSAEKGKKSLRDFKPAPPQLLRPLSSLRRSVSPGDAGSHKITTDLRPNAFTALMQGNNLDKQWADAAENEAQPYRKGIIRPAPFYKVLDGMTIAVDAFKYGKIPGVEAYFLSHAHSDHYTNLSSSWCNGPIYCSIGTANLIRYKLGVKDEWLHPLHFDKPYEIAGIKVTVLDANHCPGSSIFVFEGPHTSPTSPYHKSPKKVFRYLHCGDFRASPWHLLQPALKGKKVDICYLDTTYLNPRYCFPAQEQVVDACAELIRCRVQGDRDALARGSGGGAQLVRQGEMMKGWLSKAKKEEEELDEDSKALIVAKPAKPAERLLVMVGTYSIGKERIVKGIARAIGAKIYCDQRKKEIFACQNDPELMSMVTDDPLEGQIHVTWLGQIKVDLLSDYLDKYKPHFTSIVGLRPTGWTFKPEGSMALSLKSPSVIQMLSRELQRSYNPSWMTPTKDSTRTVEAYGVPYSEHSSFAELTCFAVSLDCVRFIPTVNVGSKKSRDAMAVWFTKWAGERKRRREAGEPSMVPHRSMHYW